MRKVAIVGVEGSGKTVMLACLGELYTTQDERGHFLEPENFQTAAYVMDKISRMRNGEWPMATADDAMQGLNWTLRKKKSGGGRPEDICEISFLDFGGEVYRAAFGIRGGEDQSLSNEIKQLKDYITAADDLIVLINLRDVINKGATDKRVQESIWITSSILKSALSRSKGSGPRASIVITQADSYADTIRMCGGARGVLAKYLPHVSNSYDWLDIFDVMAVDKTVMDDEGNIVPARDFKPVGLRVLMNWILNSKEESTPKKMEPQKKGVNKSSSNNSRPSATKTVRIDANSEEILEEDEGEELPDMEDEGEELPRDDIEVADKVNILSYIIALIASGMTALGCFEGGYWIIGIVQSLLFLATLGARGETDFHQGEGRWFWYALLLFVGGSMGCEGLWLGALIVDFICIGVIYKGK